MRSVPPCFCAAAGPAASANASSASETVFRQAVMTFPPGATLKKRSWADVAAELATNLARLAGRAMLRMAKVELRAVGYWTRRARRLARGFVPTKYGLTMHWAARPDADKPHCAIDI